MSLTVGVVKKGMKSSSDFENHALPSFYKSSRFVIESKVYRQMNQEEGGGAVEEGPKVRK